VPIATKIPEEETNEDDGDEGGDGEVDNDGDDETLLDMEMDEVQQFILVQDHHVKCDQIGGKFAIWLLLLEHFLHFYTNEQFKNIFLYLF
jgi:hypothetical protein